MTNYFQTDREIEIRVAKNNEEIKKVIFPPRKYKLVLQKNIFCMTQNGNFRKCVVIFNSYFSVIYY